jgi:hypothetical protein
VGALSIVGAFGKVQRPNSKAESNPNPNYLANTTLCLPKIVIVLSAMTTASARIKPMFPYYYLTMACALTARMVVQHPRDGYSVNPATVMATGASSEQGRAAVTAKQPSCAWRLHTEHPWYSHRGPQHPQLKQGAPGLQQKSQLRQATPALAEHPSEPQVGRKLRWAQPQAQQRMRLSSSMESWPAQGQHMVFVFSFLFRCYIGFVDLVFSRGIVSCGGCQVCSVPALRRDSRINAMRTMVQAVPSCLAFCGCCCGC